MVLLEMIRTQIQLTDEQARHVKRIAAERQVSMATVIRQGVDLLLRSTETATTDEERTERALLVAGKFRSGGRDGAAQHDLYLQDAYRR